MSTSEKLYSLWVKGDLLLDKVTWCAIEDEMGYRCLHKRDIDIEVHDNQNTISRASKERRDHDSNKSLEDSDT